MFSLKFSKIFRSALEQLQESASTTLFSRKEIAEEI